MRKGEDRRQAILQAAERLFYTKGYEQTSVQDIIDELSFSKGGFYHHFDSKLSLLEAICQERAQQSFLLARKAVDECDGNAVDKLNAMFEHASILQTDDLSFIGLLIRVAYREDGALMREKLKAQQLRLNRPLMSNIIRQGIEEEVFFSPYSDEMSELILRLSMQLSDEISFLLATNGQDIEVLIHITDKLKVYRYAMERLLEAPYGSIVIYSVTHMAQLCQHILQRQGE